MIRPPHALPRLFPKEDLLERADAAIQFARDVVEEYRSLKALHSQVTFNFDLWERFHEVSARLPVEFKTSGE